MVLPDESPCPVNRSSGFSLRLREYILKKHGSVNAFCRATGIKYPAQMTPYLKGKCLPGKKMLERLRVDGADIVWLQNGKSNEHASLPLSNTFVMSRYRMDVDNLLRQVRQHLSRIDDASRSVIEAYAVIDNTWRIVDLSGSLEKFLGYDKGVLSEVALEAIIHADDYPTLKAALLQPRFDDDILSFSSRFMMASGAYVKVEWSLYIKCMPMSDLNEYAIILRRSCP